MRDDHEALASHALLFHGRLGGVSMPPSESIRHANKACPPGATRRCYTGAGFVSLLAASHFTHIISANLADGVDAFIHSWNPEMGSILDAAYPHKRVETAAALGNSSPPQAISVSQSRATAPPLILSSAPSLYLESLASRQPNPSQSNPSQMAGV